MQNQEQYHRHENFRKKTQKTPKREIERAKAERDDYLARKEAE